MQSQPDLQTQFLSDAAQIATDLVRDYGLTFKGDIPALSDPMLRWMDFAARYVSPRPRTIVASLAFPKSLPTDIEQAFRTLESKFQQGEDVNHFQSKGLVLHNDTSGMRRQSRTDLLWADWGVHHFHLTREPVPLGSYFSARSDWLLFCIVQDDSVGLVDIREHSEIDLFADKELINIIVRSWPHYMNQFRLDGVLAANGQTTAEELSKLRKSGIATAIEVDGQVYVAPGMGVTTASTASRVTSSIVKVRRCLRELARIVSLNDSQFRRDAAASGIQQPEFRLTITAQGLSVFEVVSKTAYPLPRTRGGSETGLLGQLHDLLVPEWALRQLLRDASEA
jgi:hypothetical protein